MRTRAWMLVFSSVEMTNSSSRSACPCQVRPYRSRIRPALASNCGSRGKIQQRCCQGRIASSCSQRQTVLSLIRATNPECSACRATSATLSRDNGRPKVAGSSQASALISTLISGGKSPGATWAGSFLQARQSLLEEALSPQTDHFSPSVQPGRDLIVAHPLGRHENHPGPLYFEIWQRISRRPKTNQHGAEYWSARDLQPLLGYSQWWRFEQAIERALTSDLLISGILR